MKPGTQRLSHKTILAALIVTSGALTILGGPALVFADWGLPVLRAFGFVDVLNFSPTSPTGTPCFELVHVHYGRAFAIIAAFGVFLVFFGTRLFIKSQRSI
jgi:hypothetical protein